MRFALSICIPTYNRLPYLREAVDAILQQASGRDVEIIISDNASEDGTDVYAQELIRTHKNIKYFRFEANMGADLNYLKSVELATGDYCWFHGSDDILKNGAILRILDEIVAEPDIVLCNRTNCTEEMRTLGESAWMLGIKEDHLFTLTSDTDRQDYFRRTAGIGALFSFLTSIVFRRERWNAVEYSDEFTGTLYSHAFILLSIVDEGCCLKYVMSSLVLARGNNCSFSGKGVVQRFLYDFDGYLAIANRLYANKPSMKEALLSTLVRDHFLYMMKTMVLASPDQRIEIRRKAQEIGFGSSQLRLMDLLVRLRPLSIVPIKLIALLRSKGLIS